jgi:hypothetical protein
VTPEQLRTKLDFLEQAAFTRQEQTVAQVLRYLVEVAAPPVSVAKVQYSYQPGRTLRFDENDKAVWVEDERK